MSPQHKINPAYRHLKTVWWIIFTGFVAACLAIAAAHAEPFRPWIWMWCMTVTLLYLFKIWTVIDAQVAFGNQKRKVFVYLFCWPGLNAHEFFGPDQKAPEHTPLDWIWAWAKTLMGVVIVFWAAFYIDRIPDFFTGWIAMIGLALLLHFGSLEVASLNLLKLGFNAPPIMNYPFASKSVIDLWSARWNRAFTDLARELIIKPVRGRYGHRAAFLSTFLFSGLAHDFVISLPARGGYGLPTLYFFLQGTGALFERSKLGRRMGLRRGWRGRAFAVIVALVPLPILFHPIFIDRIVIPMLRDGYQFLDFWR